MVPDEMPIWTTDDILTNGEYEDDSGKKSTVGWLKSLYLWREEGDLLFNSTAKDYREYEEAVRAFKQANKIPLRVALHDWEDNTNASKQRIALNKFRKAQGYVVEK